MQDLWRLSAIDLALLIKKRSVSAREAAISALARLDAVNPAINAVVDHRPADVLAQADAVDAAIARGALRSQLVPRLNTYWPAWRETLARHARQASEANEVLTEVAASDLESLELDPQDRSFSLLRWRALSHARQVLVLRHWLQMQDVAMPGERRLADLLRQLRQLHALGHDRELLWQHGAVAVRCKQGRVLLSSG